MGLWPSLSRVFSFELELLKKDLDSVISRYTEISHQPEYILDENREFVEDVIDDPNEALRYHHFKLKYIFLYKNFEKISIFNEDTIKSIININSLIEEFDTLSKENEPQYSVEKLKSALREINVTLNLLKKNETSYP